MTDLRDQAALVAFNRALAAIVAEYVKALEMHEEISHREAVALAAAWQASYMRLVHGQADPGVDR